MSIQHSQYKNTVKKTKLGKVDENVSSFAKYKSCAILKYCKENGIEKNQLEDLSSSNELHNLGLCYILYR